MNILNLFKPKKQTHPQPVLTEEDLLSQYPRRPQAGEVWKFHACKDPFDPPEQTAEVLDVKANWVRFNIHTKQRTEYDWRWKELKFLSCFDFHSEKI